MKNFRTLALTAFSTGLIAIGSSMAIAQSANNSDNTSPGESGHGTGCSNGQTAGSGVGTGGDTNCMGDVSKTMNNNGTKGTYDPNSTNNSNVITNNPDNSTSGETGHGQGCSNGQTAGSGQGTNNGGTGTNCQNTTVNP